MKKKKLIKAIISIILIIIGGLLIAFGGKLGDILNSTKYEPLTHETLDGCGIGDTMTFKVPAMCIYELEDGIYSISTYEDEDLAITASLSRDMVKLLRKREDRDYEEPFDVKGILRELPNDLRELHQETLIRELSANADLFGIEINDETLQYIRDCVADGLLEVTAIGNDRSDPTVLFIAGGVVLAVVGLFLLLSCFFKVKKFIIALLIIILILALIVSVILFNRLRTMATIKDMGGGLYTMECKWDYDPDGYINSDIANIDDLVQWIGDKLLFGFTVKTGYANFGCSAFTVTSPEDGHILMGRNFDYRETDQVIVHTKPKGGYESYGVADLEFLGIGIGEDLDPDSIAARYMMLCAPYITMDGINEKGVGVAILELSRTPEVHQDNGKSDLLVFSAIRGILDNCADVDEAIAFLDNYDIHSMLNVAYHLYISDASGRAAIIEWFGNEMSVVEDNKCENFVQTQNEFYLQGDGTERYDIMQAALDKADNALDKSAAMELLDNVHLEYRNFTTEWSCVYDLTDFSFDICIDADYDKVYSFK